MTIYLIIRDASARGRREVISAHRSETVAIAAKARLDADEDTYPSECRDTYRLETLELED